MTMILVMIFLVFASIVASLEVSVPTSSVPSNLTGKHRRILRSLSIKNKAQDRLPVVSIGVGIGNSPKTLQIPSIQQSIPSTVVESINQILTNKCELCNIKFVGSVQKKKDAKLLGEVLAQDINVKFGYELKQRCEVVQALGHGVLLYLPPKTFATHSDKIKELQTGDSFTVGSITQEMQDEYARQTSLSSKNDDDNEDNNEEE